MKAAEARRLALALPEAAEAPHFDHASFRIRGRIFATLPPDAAHLHVFVDDDARERALAIAPAATAKLLWGGKVVGVRIVLAEAKAPLVGQLLENAWSRKAPKRLVAARRGS